MKALSCKKVLSSLIALITILCISASAFAYSFAYSSMPGATQTAITNAYYNDYLSWDQGYDYLSLLTFKETCTAFSTKSSPSWSTVADWIYSSLADATEFTNYGDGSAGGYVSTIARAIYAECSNLSSRSANMHAVAEVIMNRANVDYGNYGGYCIDQVLASGQFSCMRDGNIGASNPVYYTSDISNWCYAVFLANHMESETEPLGYDYLDTDYYNFYDISWGMPFYIYSGGIYTQCTPLNVTSANRYKTGAIYNIITATPIKLGTHVYFSY